MMVKERARGRKSGTAVLEHFLFLGLVIEFFFLCSLDSPLLEFGTHVFPVCSFYGLTPCSRIGVRLQTHRTLLCPLSLSNVHSAMKYPWFAQLVSECSVNVLRVA